MVGGMQIVMMDAPKHFLLPCHLVSFSGEVTRPTPLNALPSSKQNAQTHKFDGHITTMHKHTHAHTHTNTQWSFTHVNLPAGQVTKSVVSEI